jgi:hypothetical protein
VTRSAWRQSLLVLLLALGFCLWLISDRDTPTSLEVIFGLVAFLICAVPSVNGSISRTLDRIREIPLKRRVFASISSAVIAIDYIYLTSIEQGRSFRMILHDEFMFRLQSQMLARGRLWMTTHKLADFF